MGRVYLAHDALLERDVALKELAVPVYLSGEERKEVRDRFTLEARAAARLTHPHILTVHDIVVSGDRQFIVMEYLEGKTLRQILSERIFSSEELLSIAPMVSEALDYAHSQGVVHRDIKPDNIFVLESGTIKVADFGIAKMLKVSDSTHTDVIMGTPNYIAPELVKGLAYDYRVDIFSLGVTLYELLLGRRPFDADNDYAIIYKVASEEPVPLDELRDDLPPELVRAVHRALEKNPDRRYANMKELQEDLMKIRAELGMATVEKEEPFDKEKALQSELEMARDVDDSISPDGGSSGETDFQRDREWKELIARIYHKDPDERDIALTASKRTRWEDLEAMARGEKVPAAEGVVPGGVARAREEAAAQMGTPVVPRLPRPAPVSPVKVKQAPEKSIKLVDPVATMHWSIMVIAAGLLLIISVMLPWITGDLHTGSSLYGISFPEGVVITVLTVLILCADALVLLGVGEPRTWATVMKVLSFLCLLTVLFFFGLRIFGGVGYQKPAGIGGLSYLTGIGYGLWMALASSAVIYWACLRVGKAACLS